MSRIITVGAAQLGPIEKEHTKTSAVERLIALMRQASSNGCDLVVFPELALTTFFPRWFVDDITEADHWYETSMPSPVTQPLFDEARRLSIGFSLGYAELTPDGHRFNTQILVEKDGSVVAKYHKVHIPGHEHHEPDRPFQHAERYYFEPGPEGFGVWKAFGARVGMMICNDRRWPETYRVMGLKGVEMITWVVGVAKGGVEEGVDSLGQTCIVAPSGQIVAQAYTTGDELVVARCDLDWCSRYKDTLFNFDKYRRPEVYGSITAQKGVIFED